MKSLVRLGRFLRPYRVQSAIALILLILMVAADLAVPRLTQRVIDQGIVTGNLGVVIATALLMVGASLLSTIFALSTTTFPSTSHWDSALICAMP